MKPHTHITSALLLIGALCYAPLTFAQAWEDLSSDSQQVLRPLRINWEELSTAQKQSWLKRVPELKAMPKEQRNTAQSRMAEWGALSQQQRYEVQSRVKNSVASDPGVRAKLWNKFIGH